METIQETGEILIFADINGKIAQLVRNGWSVTINGTWLQLSVLKQVQEEVRYGFQRCCPEVHLITEAPLCKNGPLCLIDRSGWSSFRSLNSCCHCLSYLIAVALGSRHVGSGLTGTCAGSGWMIESPDWADWANTVESDWTWPLDPRTRAYWATPVQSVWFCCMGSPATSPLCPRWLLVGRHMGPDLPRTDWVHSLPMPGVSNQWLKLWQFVVEPGGKQVHLGLVPPAWNTSGWRDHSVWMVWPSLDSLSAIMFSRPGMCWALRVTCLLVHQVKMPQ